MVHKSVLKRALAAAKAAAYGTGAFWGFCLACGAKVPEVNPDGRKEKCPKCHAAKVYGAEEIVMMGGMA